MLEAFTCDSGRQFAATPGTARPTAQKSEADVAVKILTTEGVSEGHQGGTSNDLARSIVHMLKDSLSKNGVTAKVVSTSRPAREQGFLRRLSRSIRPASHMSPAQRLETALLKLAMRFEDRRVLMIIANDDEADGLMTPAVYAEAVRLDIEVLLLSIRTQTNGTAAVLKQKGFHIQLSDVTEYSARDISALLCRGILGTQP
jgi:hypothetical protein